MLLLQLSPKSAGQALKEICHMVQAAAGELMHAQISPEAYVLFFYLVSLLSTCCETVIQLICVSLIQLTLHWRERYSGI